MKIFKSPFFYPIIILIIIIPTFISIVRVGFFTMQDDLQALRIQQMDKCFQDLQIPCRWVPDMGFGYGYPQFEFYSPSIFYIGEALHLIGFQFIDAVKILFALGFIFSALSMFLLLKAFLNDWSAFVGAVLYSYVPFKATEVYVRGSINEFWALAIFPLIFWSTYQLIKTNKWRYGIYLALFLGFLLLTHNLMSLIFLPLAGIWTLTWLILEKRKDTLPKLMTSVILGIGLAAFFILPIPFEKQYIHLDSILSGYFDYRQHFVDIRQMFFSNYFGYGSSVLGPNDDLSLSVGIVHWIAGLMGLFLAFMNFKKSKKISIVVMVISITLLPIFLLMHQKSSFIWETLGFLKWLQFPWRLLADSSFLLSILAACGVYLVGFTKQKFSYVIGIILIIAVIGLHGNFFHPKDWLNISDQDKFTGKAWDTQLTTSIFDYLPIYSELPPPHMAPDLPEVLNGQVTILEYKKGSDYQTGRLQLESDATIRLPLYDFPGMKVLDNGMEINHNHDNCLNEPFCEGLITFNLGQGTHIIKAILTNTPIRVLANWLTVLSLVLTIIISVYAKNKRIL